MKIEMGESLFYSWLRHVKECQIVQTNWKVSRKWNLLHEPELKLIKEETDKFFHEKHGYEIYKKNASLAQIIQQGESDAVGISFLNGSVLTYAIDIAFHESGLNYGNEQETIMKIINKCIRTAICLYGFMDVRNAEIIFASPKIRKGILDGDDGATKCIQEAQDILTKLGYEFNFRIIANKEFKTAILDPILMVSDDIADTNELFMRSYQMLQMFDERITNVVSGETKETLRELKIGKLAQIMIQRVLQSGKVPDYEFEQMFTPEYSKEVFGINYPVLARLDKPYDRSRYYSTPIQIGDDKYALCSQWFETKANNDRPYLEQWIVDHQ